eukprot:Colp12_sorted_trinity150504_noHs@33686
MSTQGQFTVCANFDRGSCVNDQCPFVHNVNKEATDLTSLCHDFVSQKCERPKCKFVHNINPTARFGVTSGQQNIPAAGPAPPGLDLAAAWAAYYQAYANPNDPSTMAALAAAYQYAAPTQGISPYLAAAAPVAATASPYAAQPHLAAALASPYSAASAAPAFPATGLQTSANAPPGCTRSSCTYLHDVNLNSSRGAPVCHDFETTKACHRPNCHEVHNVNASARLGNPVCADFKTAYRHQHNQQQAMLQTYIGAYANPAFNRPQVVVCQDYNRGRCSRDNCQFVHNTNPDARDSTSLCHDYSLGRCTRDRCKYLHNDNKNATGARASGSAKRPADFGPEEECADFARGRCNRPNCRFIHNANRHSTSSQSCGDFSRGRCTREMCKFMHVVQPGSSQNDGEYYGQPDRQPERQPERYSDSRPPERQPEREFDSRREPAPERDSREER